MSEYIKNHYISGSQLTIELSEQLISGNSAVDFVLEFEKLITTDVKSVVMDCKNIMLINSSGLGLIISVHSKCKNEELDFHLTNVTEKLNSLLSMTHLDKVLKIS